MNFWSDVNHDLLAVSSLLRPCELHYSVSSALDYEQDHQHRGFDRAYENLHSGVLKFAPALLRFAESPDIRREDESQHELSLQQGSGIAQ
jgi:hypothetical protein